MPLLWFCEPAAKGPGGLLEYCNFDLRSTKHSRLDRLQAKDDCADVELMDPVGSGCDAST